jgi:hypothetical protein
MAGASIAGWTANNAAVEIVQVRHRRDAPCQVVLRQLTTIGLCLGLCQPKWCFAHRAARVETHCIRGRCTVCCVAPRLRCSPIVSRPWQWPAYDGRQNIVKVGDAGGCSEITQVRPPFCLERCLYRATHSSL